MINSPQLNPPKCPDCDGDFVHIPESKTIASFFASMIGAEIFMYIAAGLLFAVGMFWYPALIIGFIFAVYIFFIMSKDTYLCKKCGKQVKRSDLYKKKNT